MTHLRIELNNIQENVNNMVIEKLYEIASNGDLDASSNLSGLLHVPIVYKAHALYLTTMFPELTIAADDYAIPFEDPAMVTYLNSIGVGSNGIVTEAQAAAATVVANSANTTVTKFNELKYFTNVTSSKGGYSGSGSGYTRFFNWTALEEIDISNFTSIGHNHGYAWEDTFRDCTSLTTVKASNKLIKIGNFAFGYCQNLESITGLEGTIDIYGCAFYNCTKLPSSVFANCELNLVGGGGAFYRCKAITNIPISSSCTLIPESFFLESSISSIDLSNVITIGKDAFFLCTSLTSVDLSSCTSIGLKGFYNCNALSSVGNSSNVTSIGSLGFCACTSLTSINLSNCTSLGSGCFNGCTSLTLVTLNSSISNIPSSMFLNCRALTTVTGLGNNTLTVGPFSFLNCESINFPNVITIYPTTGNTNSSLLGLDVVGTFNGCKLNKVVLTGGDLNLGLAFISNSSTLTEVQGLDKIKYLSGGSFYNDPLLTGTLSFPNCVGSGTRNNGTNCPVNYNMFYNIGATRIELPLWNSEFRDTWATLSGRPFFENCPNLTTVLIHVSDNGFPNYRGGNIRSVLFGNCPNFTTLIINNQTVPALKNTSDIVQPIDIGGNNVTLYVPDAIVNDYKTATGWSNIASLIKGISELPT